MRLAIIILAGLVVISSVFLYAPRLWHNTYCELVLPLTEWEPEGVERLLECSNIPQTRLDSHNVSALADGNYNDWIVLSPADKIYPATQKIEVEGIRDKVILFPRMGSENDSVSVYQVVGDIHRQIFFAKGQKGWSNIGKQCMLRLGCTFDGYYKKPLKYTLEVHLKGPTAQLWTLRGEKIFF